MAATGLTGKCYCCSCSWPLLELLSSTDVAAVEKPFE